MAISGDSYLKASKDAFMINIKYCPKYFMAKQTLEFINTLGKFAYPIINMWIFYAIIQLKEDTFTYSEMIWPMIVVGMFTYYVCTIFLDLYNEIMLALLLSLAIDMDLNNEVPKFGPTHIHNKLEYVYNFHQKQMIAHVNQQLNRS